MIQDDLTKQQQHPKKKASFINLGCAKNRVITEKIAFLLLSNFISVVPESNETNYFLINTCGFLETARQETEFFIQNVIDTYSVPHKNIIVFGCYASRFPDRLREQFPDITIIEDRDPIAGIAKWLSSPVDYTKRMITTSNFAYLRISEGCSKQCAYCLIPSIKGPYRSFSKEDILRECNFISTRFHVKELILLAQDTSLYGSDLQSQDTLISLVDSIQKLRAFRWIRVLYLYPTFSVENIRKLLSIRSVVPYLDIPLQHLHPDILTSMKRPPNAIDSVASYISLRKEFPTLAIRSTFIVGYPGETESQFQFLLSNLQKYPLDRVGFFTYSREQFTSSYDLPNQIPEEVKIHRLQEAYAVQEKISQKLDTGFINTNLPVLLEHFGYHSQAFYGRSTRESPDVDLRVQVKGDTSWLQSKIGSILPCSIKEVTPDLIKASPL